MADESELLAGEYVLGTLAGEQRAEFERRLPRDSALQAQVVAWEQRLAPFLDDLPPRRPPMSVWRGIEQQLDAQTGAAGGGGWWRSLGLWRGLTAAAVLGLALVVVVPQLQPPQAPQPVYSLVMRGEDQSPQWLMVVDWRQRSMDITRVAAAEQVDRDYELWLLPVSGDAPVSLGVLRGQALQASLPAGYNAGQTKAFAVSLEPAGGSPTGAPTGPVLYLAEPRA